MIAHQQQSSVNSKNLIFVTNRYDRTSTAK